MKLNKLVTSTPALTGFMSLCVLLSSTQVLCENINLVDSSSLSLSDVLKSSLKTNMSDVGSKQMKFQTSRWLAASPSAELSILKGKQDTDSDELAFSLNFEIKSGRQREIDKKLSDLNLKIEQKQAHLKNLYLSGLIREAAWGYRIAESKQKYLLKKEKILRQLEINNQKLTVAGESNQYGQLLIQKEINNTKIDTLSNRQEVNKWAEQYNQITGLIAVPDKISEKEITFSQVNLSQHPELNLIQNQWQQKSLTLQASNSDAAPWNLSLTTKSTENLAIKDEQLGISFEVPLNFVQSNSQSNKNEWVQGKVKFDLDHQSLMLKLTSQIKQLIGHSQLLQKKKILLEDSVNLSKLIMKQIDQLQAGNELSQEVILRRVLEAIQTENDYALTQLQIQKNNAMLRQSAGISL